MKLVGYLRVSGQTQVEGDGFPRQEEIVRAFCKAHNLELIDVFREEGVSGTVEGLDRPEFARLLDSAPAAIVVERMDRLARDLMVSEVLLRECRLRGIKVFSADQGALIDMANDEGDPTRTLIRQIMGALAQWEKSVLVKKLYAARKRTGRWGGDPAYGTKPGEQRVVAFMQQARGEGRSFSDIATSLNTFGMPTRHNKRWDKKTVQRVLSRLNAPSLQSDANRNVETVCTA